jgi:hypothetical protein
MYLVTGLLWLAECIREDGVCFKVSKLISEPTKFESESGVKEKIIRIVNLNVFRALKPQSPKANQPLPITGVVAAAFHKPRFWGRGRLRGCAKSANLVPGGFFLENHILVTLGAKRERE